MSKIVHSVTLDSSLCKGCTSCVKHCPTEAIRVRDKKAVIIKERCVDCGNCIRICPHHAKKGVVDPFSILSNWEYTVALPAPTLYAQFKDLLDRNVLLTALKHIGFDDVFEVSAAAEIISAATSTDLTFKDMPKPLISSACPAVVRIIRVRFPSLIPHLVTYRSPMELAARWAGRLAVKKTGLPREKIGCIFISPCPAKSTSRRTPIGTHVSAVDGVVSIAELYPRLHVAMKQVDKPEQLAHSSTIGVNWALSGGESQATASQNHICADGMDNVIRILEALEDDKISNVDFVELNACVGGCVGGALTVENPFIARTQMERLMKQFAPVLPPQDSPLDDLSWDDPVEFEPVMQLDSNIVNAMDKLSRIKELEEHFNGMDCGACGAPSCRALAEDIVGGFASEDQCIFLIREKLQKLLDQMPKEKASEEENAK